MKWRLFALSIVIGIPLFLQQTGWFSSPKSWRETSGWNKLKHPPLFVNDSEPRLHWLGHSGFLVEWHGTRLVLDANLSKSCPPVKRLIEQGPISWPGPIDAALVSHAHYDHFDIPTLEALPELGAIVAPIGLDRYLPEKLAQRVTFEGMEVGRTIQLGSLTLTAVTAVHSGGRNHPLNSKHPALGYMISDGTTTLFYAGDTAYSEHFHRLGKEYHPDIAILPIGAFEPHFVLRYHHLNPEEAINAAEDLGVKTVIPCHFGTFRLAFDPVDVALPRFARAAEAGGVAWYMPPLLGGE